MRKYILIISFAFSFVISRGQNLISNPDFELYSSCPIGLSEVTKATSWSSVILNADYYNCSFLSSIAFPTNTAAFSGSGFTGFATYGDSTGSAEAIGQHLSAPLNPGTYYTISFAVKQTSGGNYSQTCTGLTLYGLKNNMPVDTSYIHISQLPNATFLGATAVIQNTLWQSFSFGFGVTDTVNYLIFTTAQTPNCKQYLFLDSVNLHVNLNSVKEFSHQNYLNVYPTPSSGTITVDCSKIKSIKSIQLLGVYGELINIEKYELQNNTIRLANIPDGLFILKISDKDGKVFTGKILNRL